jgi:hypothetical protein
VAAGKDSWQPRVHAGHDPLNGRKRYIERTFRGAKREASKTLVALIVEAERLTPKAANMGTFEEMLRERVARARHAQLLAAHSVHDAGYIDTAIVPGLGSLSVVKLTPADLDHSYRQLMNAARYAVRSHPATIRRVQGIIGAR